MSSLRHPGPPPSVPPPPTPSAVPRRPRSQWPSRPQSQEIKDAAVWPVKASSFPTSISAAAQASSFPASISAAAQAADLDAPLRPGSKPADIAKRSSLSALSLNRSKPLPEKPPPRTAVSRPSKRSSRPSSRNGAAAPRRADTVSVPVQRKPSDSARPSSARNQHTLQKKRSFFRRVADRLTRSRSTLREDAKRQAQTANGHSVASPAKDDDAPPSLLTETTQPAPSAPLPPVPREPEPQPPTPKSTRKPRPPSIKVSQPQPLVSSARRSPPGDMTYVTRSVRASSDQPRSVRASSERSPTSPTLLTPAHNVPLPLSPTSPLPDPDTFPLPPPPPSPRRARPRPRLSPVPSSEPSPPHSPRDEPQPPPPPSQQQQQQLHEHERRLSTARVSTWLAGPTQTSGDDEPDGTEELWRAAMRAEEEDVVLPEVERMALEAEERVRVRARSNTTGGAGMVTGAGKDKVKEARRSMSLFKRGSKALGLEYAITRTPTSASKQASPHPTQPSSLSPSTLHPPSSPTSLRAPLSPTMHTHGSILLETKDIADPESRRLSEMVFLS